MYHMLVVTVPEASSSSSGIYGNDNGVARAFMGPLQHQHGCGKQLHLQESD
jgi:hypothetical protein